MKTSTKITARYAETDQMGVIHHSVYAVWYELARTEFIKQLGITYTEMEQMGILLPVAKLECNYHRSAFYEDELTVETSITALTPARVAFGYAVYKNGEATPINTGSTLHGWTDKTLKPFNLKKRFPQLYAAIAAAQPHKSNKM